MIIAFQVKNKESEVGNMEIVYVNYVTFETGPSKIILFKEKVLKE